MCRNLSSETDDLKSSEELDAPVWNPGPSTWHLGGNATLVVNFNVSEIVGGIRRMHPSVHHDAEKQSVCVFQGYLSNLDELVERYSRGGTPLGSPSAGYMHEVISGDKEREGPAEILYRMYLHGEEPLIILSELQGQYAFVLYDGEKRQVFAARGCSGKEHVLFYEMSDDKTISVSNVELEIPASDGVGMSQWDELISGHYISGKGFPKVQQFALTPDQLNAHNRSVFDPVTVMTSNHPESDLNSTLDTDRRRSNDDFGDFIELQQQSLWERVFLKFAEIKSE